MLGSPSRWAPREFQKANEQRSTVLPDPLRGTVEAEEGAQLLFFNRVISEVRNFPGERPFGNAFFF